MKKNKTITSFVLFCLIGFTMYAQDAKDVLRYSTTDVFGSARFEAMAGSFGALGADFSAIQINPAGMGRFSSSKASISFNNSVLENDALYNGTSMQTNDNKFTLSELGIVLTTDISRSNNGRRYNQFSFGYTRLKNFSNTRSYEGQNYYSLLDVFANEGAGISPDEIYDYTNGRPFTTGLAYDDYAVDYDAATGQYYSRLTSGDMYHHRTINTKGGIGEYHIGYSENYKNKLYYGASIGIRRWKYNESYTHNERLLDTVGTTLRSFSYTASQETKGIGVNLKLGVLYLPTDQIRLGFAFESATAGTLKSTWTADMTATHYYGVETIDPSAVPKSIYSYRIKTPMKLRGSFAYVFGMRGAVNVDVEWVNLPAGKLKPSRDDIATGNPYMFTAENEAVKADYHSIFNTRIGVEYMLFRNFFVRGGIAILQQPFKKSMQRVETPNMTYAGGIGWQNDFISINVSYRLLQLKYDYYAFDPSKIENRTQFETNVHNIVLSLGYKW